jgi:hypothetical protein
MPDVASATAIGFKEWSFICEALTEGVQTIILRKGGIHEGCGGFEWKHREFFLFPTWFHTQAERLRWAPEGAARSFPPEEERQSVEIGGYATLEQVWKVTDWDRVAALAPLHVWNEDIVKERFVYDDESCLHVALVRAHRFSPPWKFPYQKSYGGCRSWVNLPEDGLGKIESATPAMSDTPWEQTRLRLNDILGTP